MIEVMEAFWIFVSTYPIITVVRRQGSLIPKVRVRHQEAGRAGSNPVFLHLQYANRENWQFPQY
jgi:hypothetical protein